MKQPTPDSERRQRYARQLKQMQVADHAVFPIRSLAASFAYVAKGLRLEVCVKKFGIVDYRVLYLTDSVFRLQRRKSARRVDGYSTFLSARVRIFRAYPQGAYGLVLAFLTTIPRACCLIPSPNNSLLCPKPYQLLLPADWFHLDFHFVRRAAFPVVCHSAGERAPASDRCAECAHDCFLGSRTLQQLARLAPL
jgi:hypothetical protein